MQIFVSSTFRDLQAERDGAFEVLRQLALVPWGMELFASEPRKPLEVALRELTLSDVMVLIIGFYAGSLIPDQCDATYTSAEFTRAKELGRRVFVFVKTENRTWVNKETDPEKRRVLEEFKGRVTSSGTTPAYFESPTELQAQIAVAFNSWEQEGRPGARRVFATHEEYFAHLKPSPGATPRLFDYEQHLYGRESTSSDLKLFLEDPDKSVGILVGRGGIGKTKLLRDWCSDLQNVQSLFVQRGASWHSEAYKEVPTGNVLVICDDAHHFSDLDHLLGLTRTLGGSQRIKLIVSTRPSSQSVIEAKVVRYFDATRWTVFPRIERLDSGSVKKLASEVLGSANAGYVDSLAALSADTPLVTVVGGRLIARGDIHPALLNNEEDFRREVFGRFSDEYERLLPPSSVNWRSLLRLIAAVSPVAPRSDVFLGGAERFLSGRPDEIVQAVDLLERHGLLMRGGSLVRIVPDVLSDFLLEQACVNDRYEPTGYAESVFRVFGGHFLSNLMRNLGELDWRISHRQSSANLLGPIWEHVSNEFLAADAAVRSEVLKQLHGVAILQPESVLEIVRVAMRETARPTKVLETYDIAHEDVLRQLPDLLEEIAHHQQFMVECLTRLWSLSKVDSRPPDQNPGSASRVLKDLASYDNHKAVPFLERVADFASALLDHEDAFDLPFTPLDIVDCLMEKEGEGRESDGISLRMWSFELNYSAVKPLRVRALSLIEKVLWMPSPRAQVRALKSLQSVLWGHLGKFGRGTTDREHDWHDAERLQALGIIEKRLSSRDLPLPLARETVSVLRTLRRRGRKDSFLREVERVLSTLAPSDDLAIYDAFCTNYWDRNFEEPDFEKAGAKHAKRVKEAVVLFTKKHRRTTEVIRGLVEMARSAEAFGVDASGSSWGFVNALCGDPEFTIALAEHTRDSGVPYFQWVQIVLTNLRIIDRRDYLKFGLIFAEHDNHVVVSGAAWSLFQTSEVPIPEDIEIMQALSRREFDWVKRPLFMAIGRVGQAAEYKDKTVEMMLGIDIGTDSKLADEMCGAMDYGNMPPSSLQVEQVENVLSKLIPVTELDEHHIGRFLNWVGRNHPTLLCDFILRRLDHYASLSENGRKYVAFRPVPHHEIGTNFRSLREAPVYGGFLSKIRDRVLSRECLDYWLCDLFWAVGAVDVQTFLVLDEWLHSGEHQKLIAVLAILSEAPEEIALLRPYFAAQVVDCCASVSTELEKKGIGCFIGNAMKGLCHSAHGEPSPKFVSIRDRATLLADAFPPDCPGHALFSALREAARREIKDEIARDADFDLRRGAI